MRSIREKRELFVVKSTFPIFFFPLVQTQSIAPPVGLGGILSPFFSTSPLPSFFSNSFVFFSFHPPPNS